MLCRYRFLLSVREDGVSGYRKHFRPENLVSVRAGHPGFGRHPVGLRQGIGIWEGILSLFPRPEHFLDMQIGSVPALDAWLDPLKLEEEITIGIFRGQNQARKSSQ